MRDVQVYRSRFDGAAGAVHPAVHLFGAPSGDVVGREAGEAQGGGGHGLERHSYCWQGDRWCRGVYGSGFKGSCDTAH
jgi:hypothetical protein